MAIHRWCQPRGSAQKFPSPEARLFSACVQSSQRPGPVTPPAAALGYPLPDISSLCPAPPLPAPPRQTTGAAYRAIGHAGTHFVPSGIPAHLEDAASASVAVDKTSTLQSKAVITYDAKGHSKHGRGSRGAWVAVG